MLWRFLTSAANWVGMLFAIAVVFAKSFGFIGSYWWALVVVGYIAGYWLGKTLFGTPQLDEPDFEALDHALSNAALPDSIGNALTAIQHIARTNRGDHFSQTQQNKLITLTDSIQDLHQQWTSTEQHLSIEDAFVVKRLSLEYLPDTVKRFMVIPSKYAHTRPISGGKTASDLFDESLDEMQAKVQELQDDLIAKDATAFANHARFLNQKFGEHFSVTKTLEKV